MACTETVFDVCVPYVISDAVGALMSLPGVVLAVTAPTADGLPG